MPIKITPAQAVVVVGLCLLVSAVAMSAEKARHGPTDSYTLIRSGAPVRGFSSEQACVEYRDHPVTGLIAVDVAARVTGEARYTCRKENSIAIKFGPAPTTPQPVNCVVSAWGPWNDPPWMACSGTQQTRALVRNRTITTQPANGGTACPVLVETSTQTQPCALGATLSWTAPTQNTDGTSLTNLAGYRIHYGTIAAALSQTAQVANPGITRYDVTGLTPGTWYFAVRAYRSDGMQSASSNVVSKVVQ